MSVADQAPPVSECVMSKNQDRIIDVRKQHSMSFLETFRLCVKGVRHRFLRSVLTLAVVVLAVAFFMFLLSESMFVRSTGQGVQEEIRHERLSQQVLTKFFTPATEMVIIRRLADAVRRGDDAVLIEFARVTGLPVETLEVVAADARREVVYINWLASIPSGKRTVLIQKHHGRGAIAFILADREGFRARLAPMIDVRVPGTRESLEHFLDHYSGHAEQITRVTDAWNAKVAAAVDVMDRMHDRGRVGDPDWMLEADPATLEAWRASIAALGFDFSVALLAVMRDQISASHARNAIYRDLGSPPIREAWMREFRERQPSTPEEKMLRLNDPRAAGILAALHPRERLTQVYDQTRYEQKLARLERRLAVVMDEESGWLGLSGRQLFLLAISFVVCMVGISNAMLMSITERFREIATMKCLGATDAYILTQFMLEAALQGFIGGLLGVLIGFAIASLRGLLNFGSHLVLYWPWMDLGVSAFTSVLAGVLLAILASIQPSWSASRMAPMEAMRVE